MLKAPLELLFLQVAWEPKGTTAIWFVFVGHPLLAFGLLLTVIALVRRLRRECTASASTKTGAS